MFNVINIDKYDKSIECHTFADAMLQEIIDKNLIPACQFIYGFADLRGLLAKEFEEYPFGISIGKKLDDSFVRFACIRTPVETGQYTGKQAGWHSRSDH